MTMHELNRLINEIGISKVRLAKYLGVSRQMLYNYLALENLESWPKEKAVKLLSLLDIKNEDELKDIKVNGDYIISVENRLNESIYRQRAYLFLSGAGFRAPVI